jgi:hypothetical protein
MLTKLYRAVVPVPSVALATGRLSKALAGLKAAEKHHSAERAAKYQRAARLQDEAGRHDAEAIKASRIHGKIAELLS